MKVLPIYKNYYDAIADLDPGTQGEVLRALVVYAFTDEVADVSPTALALFKAFKHNVDTSKKKAASGAKGGSKTQANRKQESSNDQATDEQSATIQDMKYKTQDTRYQSDNNAPAHDGGLIAYGRYRNVLLTQKEYDAFCKENPDNGLDVIEKLSAHMASTGRQYQNHHATLEKWTMQDRERKQELQPKNDALNYNQRKDDMMDVFMDL